MEDTTDRRPRVYEPQYESPKPSLKISRRGFLTVLAGLGLGLLGRATVFSPGPEAQPAPKTAYEVLLEKGIIPKVVYTGEVKISKRLNGQILNVRSAPNLEGLLTIWDNIRTVNGMYIKDVDGFLVRNCILVEGQNVNPEGSKGEKGLWIPVSVDNDVKYMNLSSVTSSLVEPTGGIFEPVTEFNRAGLKIKNAEFKPNQIAIITPLPKLPKI